MRVNQSGRDRFYALIDILTLAAFLTLKLMCVCGDEWIGLGLACHTELFDQGLDQKYRIFRPFSNIIFPLRRRASCRWHILGVSFVIAYPEVNHGVFSFQV